MGCPVGGEGRTNIYCLIVINDFTHRARGTHRCHNILTVLLFIWHIYGVHKYRYTYVCPHRQTHTDTLTPVYIYKNPFISIWYLFSLSSIFICKFYGKYKKKGLKHKISELFLLLFKSLDYFQLRTQHSLTQLTVPIMVCVCVCEFGSYAAWSKLQ